MTRRISGASAVRVVSRTRGAVRRRPRAVGRPSYGIRGAVLQANAPGSDTPVDPPDDGGWWGDIPPPGHQDFVNGCSAMLPSKDEIAACKKICAGKTGADGKPMCCQNVVFRYSEAYGYCIPGAMCSESDECLGIGEPEPPKEPAPDNPWI